MKLKSLAQAALMRKSRGTPKGPTKRVPAAADRPLSPEEKLQEYLETKRLRKSWDNNQLTASFREHDGTRRGRPNTWGD